MDRDRGGAYLSLGLAVIGLFGVFLFLTFYRQVVKGYEPVETGLAFLPMSAGMIIGSTQVATYLMPRVSPRNILTGALLVASLGMLMLTQIGTDTSFIGLLLPAQLVLGLGMGTAFMPAMNLATLRIRPSDAGVASAMVNTSQQVGGAIGIALLNTIAASATTSFVASNAPAGDSPADLLLFQHEAMVEGFTSAIWWGFGILVLGAAAAFALVRNISPRDVAASGPDKPMDHDEERVPVLMH